MARSERLAGMCDLAWRRRQGQHGEAAAWLSPEPPAPEEVLVIERVLARLDETAPLWNALPVGGSLTFAWPSTQITALSRDGTIVVTAI
jgi:hypothetical protein